MNRTLPPADIRALVVRLVVPAGALFPVQEYLTFAKDWSRDRKQARGFRYAVADRVAHKLTSPGCHVYPVVLSGDEERVLRAEVVSRRARQELEREWRVGVPNCGLD